MYELLDDEGRKTQNETLKFNNPAEKVNSEEAETDVYAFDLYDKVIFHQLYDVCIPEVNQSEDNKQEFGDLSDEKRTAINQIEFHLLNCSCDLSKKSQMDQCMNQKIAFTAQLLAIKSWCLIHQDKNITQIEGKKDSQGNQDGKEDKDAKQEVKMSKETVLNISMGVNKLIAQCYEPLIDGQEIDDDGKEIDLASSKWFITGVQECTDKYEGDKNTVMTGYDSEGQPQFQEKYPGGHLKCIEDNENRMAEEVKKVQDTKNQKDFKEQSTECLSKSIDQNLNCTDSEDVDCLKLSESQQKSCIAMPYLSGCVKKNNVEFKACEEDADKKIENMWNSLKFGDTIKNKRAEIEKCQTSINIELEKCKDENCRKLNHQQFMKCRQTSVKSWMKGFFKNELQEQEEKPGFFTKVYRKVTGKKPVEEKITFRANQMNMCLDRLQNCIISQRMINETLNQKEKGKTITHKADYALTKCDLELQKAKQIDDLWRTYKTALSKMKWWGRIANVILQTNIALFYLAPGYGAAVTGAHLTVQVVSVTNIIVKRCVMYYQTMQIENKLPFGNSRQPELPSLDQIDDIMNFAGSAEELFDIAKQKAREALKKASEETAEAKKSLEESAKNTQESAKKAQNSNKKELFKKWKKSAEAKMTKANFWKLSDIWLIFVNLHCPGCTEASDFSEFNSDIQVNYLQGVHAHQGTDFLYNKWSDSMQVSPLDIDEKTQRIQKSIVHDKVTNILFNMHEYHAVLKTKPDFEDLLKQFKFEIDKVEAKQMKNKSKLAVEIQNVSKVCMKQEIQADGSQKDSDSVAPSCVKRFVLMLQAKEKINTGSYIPLLNYEDGRPSFKIQLDSIRISKNWAEKTTDYANLNINKRMYNSYSVDFNFGQPSFPSYTSQVTFPADSLINNNSNQEPIIDNSEIQNQIKFVSDGSQIRIQLNGLKRQEQTSLLTNSTVLGEIKSTYLGYNIIDLKKVCEHKNKEVIKFKLLSSDNGTQAEDPQDDTLAKAEQETKKVKNINQIKIINIPMKCENDKQCSSWSNIFREKQARARIDIQIATDFERMCDWYSTDPPKTQDLYDPETMFWLFDKNQNQERSSRLKQAVATLNQITEFWKKETDQKQTRPGLKNSDKDKDNMQSIAQKYCSTCCINQPGQKDLIYQVKFQVECKQFTDYEGSALTREEICNTDTAFFFSNESIPETDRIQMKCKDLFRLK